MSRRRPPVLAVPALVLVVLLGVLLAVGALNRGDDKLTRHQLLSYEHRLTPIVKDGGEIVQEGLKAAITDLVQSHVTPPASIANEADRWAASLRQDRAKLAAVHPVPASLRAMHRKFLDALNGYAAAADALAVAGRAAAPGRSAALDRVHQAGQRADTVYDEASATLQQARKQLGLGVDPDYPTG
jgi:hypothetical protein